MSVIGESQQPKPNAASNPSKEDVATNNNGPRSRGKSPVPQVSAKDNLERGDGATSSVNKRKKSSSNEPAA